MVAGRGGKPADGRRSLWYHLLRGTPARERVPPTVQTENSHRPDASSDSVPGGVKSSGLPPRPNPLIGRERDVAALRQKLLLSEVRLLTLTGPPGVGKTRLATEVAQGFTGSFDQDAFFADLTPITDSELVISSIARAIGLRESGQSIFEQLRYALRGRRLLLILDNFEHVIPAAKHVADLLAGCPDIKVLVTSRVPLHLSWEHEFPVAPLELAAPHASPSVLQRVPAVALFVERARAVRPDFDLGRDEARPVAEICAYLEGLPLAIELAAARVKTLSPRAIRDRLIGIDSYALRLLTSSQADRPLRHRTLREAIAWSDRLLTVAQRALFHRLAVFAGGFSLESARAVCCNGEAEIDVLEGLGALVDHSVLQREPSRDGQIRFRMLQTIREYALDELRASGEVGEARVRHARYFLALAEKAEPELWGAGQIEWLDRLEAELDNLRAALDWSISEDGDRSIALRLGGVLIRFWDLRGHLSEGRQRLKRLLAVLPHRSPERVRMLIQSSYLAVIQGDFTAPGVFLNEALALSRELQYPWGIAFSTLALGVQASLEGDDDRARVLLEESVRFSRDKGEETALQAALSYLAQLAHLKGEYEQVQTFGREALFLVRKQGDRHRLSAVLLQVGLTALARGNFSESLRSFGETLQLARELDEKVCLVAAIEGIAWVMNALGRAKQAARLLGAADALNESIGGTIPLILPWRAERVRMAGTIRARLGEVAFAAVHSEGSAQPIDAVVEEALAISQSSDTAATDGQVGKRPVLLTDRESEVAALIARGLSNGEIAATLSLSRRTVETHVENIMNKLMFHARTQIAVWAVEQGGRLDQPG